MGLLLPYRLTSERGDFYSLPLLIDEKKPDSHRKGSTMDEKKCEKERSYLSDLM